MIDWDQLVREHGPLVWRTTFRLLRREADAADCFQQTFLAAFQFVQRETVKHWPAMLVRLATARSIERLRSNLGPSRPAELLEAEEDSAVTPEGGPLAAASSAELSDALRLALGRIDPIQSQVFCLACLDDLSYRQIAEQLRLSETHVGVLLHRAKASLRHELQAFDPRASLKSEVSP